MHPNRSKTKGSIATLPLLCILSLSAFSYAESENVSHSHLDIKIGQAIFEKLWVFAPSSTKSSDGLGPLYNARSCHQCHDPARKDKDSIPASLVIQLSIEPKQPNADSQDQLTKLGFIPEPIYGKQLQSFAYPGAKAEATIAHRDSLLNFNFPDGDTLTLKQSMFQIEDLAYGPLDKDLKFSPRVAPRIHGLGWLDAIPSASILAHADPDDKDQDGISGKVNWVWDASKQQQAVGKFGWKARKPTLDQQNLAALATDIGVSSWLFPQAEGDCTFNQKQCTELARQTETHLSQTHASNTEASKEMTDLLLLFTARHKTQNLSSAEKSSAQKNPRAIQIFNQIGCQKCHIPHYDNIENGHDNGMIGTSISPYTDLLLHDMGDALADDRKEFQASGHEWRTAPLWGIKTYLAESPNPAFLHDGRATTVTEAILWHDGEARLSKQAFSKLSKIERQVLINFVESL